MIVLALGLAGTALVFGFVFDLHNSRRGTTGDAGSPPPPAGPPPQPPPSSPDQSHFAVPAADRAPDTRDAEMPSWGTPVSEALTWGAPVHESPPPEKPTSEAPLWGAPVRQESAVAEEHALEAPLWGTPVRGTLASEEPPSESPFWGAPVGEAPPSEALSWGTPVHEALSWATPVQEAPPSEAPVLKAPPSPPLVEEAPPPKPPAAAGTPISVPKAPSPDTAVLLSCRGVHVAYGDVRILFGVDMDVAQGEIVALLGTNGAGKSTLLRAISGLVIPIEGTIVFGGQDITRASAVERAELGIVQVPGGKAVFPTLTVAEHFKAAGWLFAKESEQEVRARTERVLAMFPRLEERWDNMAGNLSGGEQQQLGLGMAFVAKPRLLIIDELSLGLAPTVVEQLLDIVRAIHAQGCTVILVEQSVNV
ncbi:MAG TPA: ATP-binding cassette domain-containing protein, partial [Acidimicrobiales bacterium]|nr:ATP-binding cassette domain-containing protein [Acidimicrobiales bacterium]